jgi:hypothetical protein
VSARCVTIDFSRVQDLKFHYSGNIVDRGDANDLRPRDSEGRLLTTKQIRARARRRGNKAKRRGRTGKPGQIITPQEMEALYKPLDDWDLEELARGRPRALDGSFRGRSPEWITRETHEEAMKRFKDVVRREMNSQGVTALETVQWIITNQDTDERGKPLVPAATKLQASQMLLEHIVGKPTQRVEQDISVKLQGILGAVMANPNDAFALPSQGGVNDNSTENLPSYRPAHLPGHTIPIGAEEEPIDVDFYEEDDDGNPAEHRG